MDSIFDLDHLYRTYFKMALPSVFGLMVSVVYNLADTFFIAQSNDTALIAGVSLCAPVFTALMAFGNIYGQGGSSLISRLLGQDDREGTGRVSSFCFYVALTTGVVLAALMMLFRVPLLGILGANAETMPHAQAYYTVLAIGAPATVLNFIHSNLVRCEGMATQSMIGSIGGTVINIILDPIMIFGLLGCPAMGVRGAAYATIIGQLVAAVLGIVLNQKHNTDVRVNPKKIRFNFPIIGEIYAIGFPSILMTAIGSVTTYLMNQILLAFSTTASAVYGVYFKLNSFFFMPLFGLNNAVVPIVAYNYGARNRGRIHQAIRTSTITAVTIMLLGWAAFFFLPVPLLRLFDASEAMIAIGIPAFRITSFTYPLAAVSIVASSVFQALGQSMHSMLVSLGRQLIVLIPVAYLFSLTGILDDVWLAFPIAEVVCLISSLFFLKKVLHRLDSFPQ